MWRVEERSETKFTLLVYVICIMSLSDDVEELPTFVN